MFLAARKTCGVHEDLGRFGRTLPGTVARKEALEIVAYGILFWLVSTLRSETL
jgi:hypothetical protein